LRRSVLSMTPDIDLGGSINNSARPKPANPAVLN
jgi:hypothetical protein